MSDYQCTAERFAHDVRDHQMTVIRADGENRHLRFKRPGASEYWFDLITWPGALCIDGDMGTYVFKRIEDMFAFFRQKPSPNAAGLYINPGYWHEKAAAQSRDGAIEEFDKDALVRTVIEEYRSHWRDRGDWAAQIEGFRELREQVLEVDDEHRMFAAIYDFEWMDFQFQDVFEWRTKRYTFRYIWNLYAIVWGIQQWDAAQPQEQVA